MTVRLNRCHTVRVSTCRRCRGVQTWKRFVGDAGTVRRSGASSVVCEDCSGDGVVARQRKRVGRRGQR